MAYKTEKTVLNVSVGADTEQSSQKCTANIISYDSTNFNFLSQVLHLPSVQDRKLFRY